MPPIPWSWLQTDDTVVVSVAVKNVAVSSVQIEFGTREFSLSYTLPTGADAVFFQDPLQHAIDHRLSGFDVSTDEITVNLAKMEIGRPWTSLTAQDSATPTTLLEDEPDQHQPHDQVQIQILSDLHLEFYFNKREPGGSSGYGYDVYKLERSAAVLALLGDIGLAISDDLFKFLERQLRLYDRVLFVMGNHEGYRSTYAQARKDFQNFEASMKRFRESQPELGLGIFTLLDRTRLDLSNDVTILGCTLWSNVPATSAEAVGRAMNDFKQIRSWTVEDHNAQHAADVGWLAQQLSAIEARESRRRVVVLTHHAPIIDGAIGPRHQKSVVVSAYATDLTLNSSVWKPGLICVWAFGHTHFPCDFVRDGIRLISNPRGYEASETKGCCSKFRDDFVISI